MFMEVYSWPEDGRLSAAMLCAWLHPEADGAFSLSGNTDFAPFIVFANAWDAARDALTDWFSVISGQYGRTYILLIQCKSDPALICLDASNEEPPDSGTDIGDLKLPSLLIREWERLLRGLFPSSPEGLTIRCTPFVSSLSWFREHMTSVIVPESENQSLQDYWSIFQSSPQDPTSVSETTRPIATICNTGVDSYAITTSSGFASWKCLKMRRLFPFSL